MSSYQKIQIPDKLKKERVSPETNVPNDFLLLLDELKLDRKYAQKFYGVIFQPLKYSGKHVF